MGTTINGGSCSQSQGTMSGMVTIKNPNRMQGGTSAIRMTSRKSSSKTKKQLNYNHREISGQLVRAKKSQNAATVVTRAKSRLATLQRQAGSGQYDSKEMANALAHARRMVRCAQLKVQNLREEEREQKLHKRENRSENQQNRNEVKRRVAQKERSVKSKVVTQEIQQAAKEKRIRRELAQKRRIHRSQEQNQITEADMKYLKGLKETNGGVKIGTTQGAVLDLSMEAAAMAEMQMLEAQIQQQVEQEIDAENAAAMATETALADTGMTSTCSTSSQGSLDGGAAAVSGSATINIAI